MLDGPCSRPALQLGQHAADARAAQNGGPPADPIERRRAQVGLATDRTKLAQERAKLANLRRLPERKGRGS